MRLKIRGRLAAELGLAALLLAGATPATANNIRVANISLTKQDPVTKTVNVVFDLSWENSWRDGENWDAAWVFVKFRAPGSSVWEHAVLSTNSTAHAMPANATNSAVADGKGVFIFRAGGYTGNVSYAGIKLKWDYGSNGYNFATGAVVSVSVHAIEMVYIPQGSFYLGSGGSEDGHFYLYTDEYQNTRPYLVASTNAITIGNSSGSLYYVYSGSCGDQQGVVSNTFPNGYSAFYGMKYELTQGQYADFLNKLPTNQSAIRFPNYNSLSRHTVTCNATNYYSASAPDRACNFLSWADGCAYADWSALRPMTELEFEKACRGPAYPVTNEYAWGNTTVVKITNEVGTAGSGTETATPTNANCHDSANFGPYRAGIFAARTAVTRTLSGAGYYGAMELSGNMAERCVTVGTNSGRAFMGMHGDGALATNGDADVAGWPGTNAVGAGCRGNTGTGGSAFDYACYAGPVSDRVLANSVFSGRNKIGFGWRGVRTAP